MDSLEVIKARYPGRPSIDFLETVQGFYRKKLEEAKQELRVPDRDCKPENNCSLVSHVSSARIQSLNALLCAFSHAIRAIKEGRYGICIVCEDEIPTPRLRQVPQTMHCTTCAETAEPLYKFRKFCQPLS